MEPPANSRASAGDRSARMRTRKKKGVRNDGQSCGHSSLKRKHGKPNGWACHVFGETSASDTMRLSLPRLTQRLLLWTKTWLQYLPSLVQHQLLPASMRLTTPSPTQRLPFLTRTLPQHLPSRMQNQLLSSSMRRTMPSLTQRLLL